MERAEGTSGRHSPDRPGAFAPGERLAPCAPGAQGRVELVEALGDGRWLVRLEGEPAGETPLPPYITAPLDDPSRYQTVYADEAGSAAAPTAGLHFTPELLGALDVERVTLHVGLDTFRPLQTDTLEEHVLHGERYHVEPDAWSRIRDARRVLAVGTTTTRVLETVARSGELAGRTQLYITPGFEFRRVDALLTNFHLPRSTLLALVMAFAGVRAGPRAVPHRDRRAVPVLLVRRRHAPHLTHHTPALWLRGAAAKRTPSGVYATGIRLSGFQSCRNRQACRSEGNSLAPRGTAPLGWTAAASTL